MPRLTQLKNPFRIPRFVSRCGRLPKFIGRPIFFVRSYICGKNFHGDLINSFCMLQQCKRVLAMRKLSVRPSVCLSST